MTFCEAFWKRQLSEASNHYSGASESQDVRDDELTYFFNCETNVIKKAFFLKANEIMFNSSINLYKWFGE